MFRAAGNVITKLERKHSFSLSLSSRPVSSLFSLKPPPLLASFLAARIPYLNIRKKKIIIKGKRDGKVRKERKGYSRVAFFPPSLLYKRKNGLKIVMARKEEREERLIRERRVSMFVLEWRGSSYRASSLH